MPEKYEGGKKENCHLRCHLRVAGGGWGCGLVADDGAEVLNSTEIYNWAHGRRRFGRRKSLPFGIYSRTLRTLRAMCEPVGRAPTIGRLWLWRLRNSHEDTR